MGYLQWLLELLEKLGSALGESEDEVAYFFNLTKISYLNSVIEAVIAETNGDDYDYRMRHLYEDDRINFLFYKMFYKLLFECEQSDGKALHD